MLVLPARFRNPNFRRTAVEWAIPALLLLVPLALVPLAYKWFFAVLFLVTAGTSTYYALSARRVDLVASEDGVTLGGVRGSQHLAWSEIERFEIRPPRARKPLPLHVAPGIDQANLILTDGSSVRIRAIEPRHGFTVLAYFTSRRETEADRTVDALNGVLARRTAGKVERRD